MDGQAATRELPIRVLLVDDDARDVDLTREALGRTRVSMDLHVARDGEECMRFLRRAGDFANAVRPDVILLDLNMPRTGGREVLAEIKSDPQLRRIPVIVLTTSRSEDDVRQAYDLHANCYLVKPVSFSDYAKLLRMINDFWFHAVTLPPPG